MVRRLIALARTWLRFDPTPEREKAETNQRLQSQAERLRALARVDTVRPAYSAAGDRVERRKAPR